MYPIIAIRDCKFFPALISLAMEPNLNITYLQKLWKGVRKNFYHTGNNFHIVFHLLNLFSMKNYRMYNAHLFLHDE